MIGLPPSVTGWRTARKGKGNLMPPTIMACGTKPTHLMVLAYLDRTDRIREVAEQSILPKMGAQIADDRLVTPGTETDSLPALFHFRSGSLNGSQPNYQPDRHQSMEYPCFQRKSGFAGGRLSVSVLSESRRLEI